MHTTAKPLYLSKKGMKEIKKQVARLERDVATAMSTLKDLDKTDGHDERLDRAEKLAQLEIIESELADKKLYLSQAKLYPSKRERLKVAIGSVVDLIDTNGRMVRYTIVDSIEADPSDGRISFMSPLGKNLLGKQIKDIILWGSGERIKQLQLVHIT
ncbi:Transcription elongation factor GreA [compost metagenome]|jgi:transcription elongation factor GreA